jgi:hypothetical protein
MSRPSSRHSYLRPRDRVLPIMRAACASGVLFSVPWQLAPWCGGVGVHTHTHTTTATTTIPHTPQGPTRADTSRRPTTHKGQRQQQQHQHQHPRYRPTISLRQMLLDYICTVQTSRLHHPRLASQEIYRYQRDLSHTHHTRALGNTRPLTSDQVQQTYPTHQTQPKHKTHDRRRVDEGIPSSTGSNHCFKGQQPRSKDNPTAGKPGLEPMIVFLLENTLRLPDGSRRSASGQMP